MALCSHSYSPRSYRQTFGALADACQCQGDAYKESPTYVHNHYWNKLLNEVSQNTITKIYIGSCFSENCFIHLHFYKIRQYVSSTSRYHINSGKINWLIRHSRWNLLRGKYNQAQSNSHYQLTRSTISRPAAFNSPKSNILLDNCIQL